MSLEAIKARLGSISPAKRLKIATLSTAADRLIDDIKWLIAEVERLKAENRSLTDMARED